MSSSIEDHRHFIKYLKAIKPEMVIPALDNCLQLKIINKKQYKLILNEVRTKL